MLSQLLKGSASLRKIAAIPASARAVGKVLKTVGKGVKAVVKRPGPALTVALLGPGAYKRWKTTVQQASPYGPANIHQTAFWRRPQ